MKTIVVLSAFAVIAFAEKEAPYPPSGWKPDGPQLTYPPPTQPSNEYGPASTPAPTEQPTEPPKEPAPTYIPSEQTSEAPGNGGYAKFQQRQRFSQPAPPAQFNQAAGQFFIITPQGQLQHIPIVVPQSMNRDVENVEPDNERRTADRFVQQPMRQQKGKAMSALQPTEFTPDGRLEKVRQESSMKAASQPSQEQTQFVAFIPAVPFRQVENAAAAAALMQPATIMQPQSGQYHVIQPNGKLQRVQYMNVLGPDNRLRANVQYQEVDPLRGPLYTFGSPLVRVL
ncbi:hypothetical protein RUM43_007458 [Polyplax serrata]|uniref:DUF4794 domain-containing protein n=1 Tax=Polyplax serrata TaxID=468196 RepID=A0AAN8PMA2_POLSC